MVTEDKLDAIRALLPGLTQELPTDAHAIAAGTLLDAVLYGWDDDRGHHAPDCALAAYVVDLARQRPEFRDIGSCLVAALRAAGKAPPATPYHVAMPRSGTA